MPPSSTPRLATISTVISTAGAVVAAACAIISTNQVLKAVQIDAQGKVFALKLDACDSFGETTATVSSDPLLAASDAAGRRKIVRSANRLIMLFPEDVKSAGLKFINQIEIVYAARNGGPRDLPLNMALGSMMQAAIELEQACQSDIRKSAQGSP
jgi:hypothetical protein